MLLLKVQKYFKKKVVQQFYSCENFERLVVFRKINIFFFQI